MKAEGSPLEPHSDLLGGWPWPCWMDLPFLHLQSTVLGLWYHWRKTIGSPTYFSLSRKSLESLLVGFLFMYVMFGMIMWRLRFSLWVMCKQVTRPCASRGRYRNGESATGGRFTTDSYVMEECHVNDSIFHVYHCHQVQGPVWLSNTIVIQPWPVTQIFNPFANLSLSWLSLSLLPTPLLCIPLLALIDSNHNSPNSTTCSSLTLNMNSSTGAYQMASPWLSGFNGAGS